VIPKILLGAPINQRKAYVLDEWLSFIRTLTYPNLHIILVDNSNDPKWHKTIIAKGFDVRRVEPKGRPEAYIAASQEVIREYALANGFDYLFSLECDNFCPVNTIELLLARRLDNINVPYFLKEGVETVIGVQVMGISQVDYRRYDVLPPCLSMDFMNGKLRTGVPSIGCSLFSRKLLKMQKFRVVADQMGKFSDSWWHLDSINNGITPYVDTTLFSTHKRNNQWTKIR
jgi:hypothetical protein